MRVLAWRRARSAGNALARSAPYDRAKTAAFALAGLGLLAGLHAGFHRVLAYLMTVEPIGRLLVWKLTALLLMATLSMTVVSSLLTSLTTLFYSYDLRFLMNAPLSPRAVFLDKALESAFFASWMLGLVLAPFALALARAQGLGASFIAACALLLPPFLLLGTSVGTAFTLVLMAAFPSSRTRDAVWALSSLSLTVVYGLVRLAQPERLARPDALGVVAEYLAFLQAPTARYLPSWWLARGARAAAEGRWGAWAADGLLLWTSAAAAYAALTALAGRLYFPGYSGAQAGVPRRIKASYRRLRAGAVVWKDATLFLRDVRHWSQMALVAGLVFVYLFSLRRLPLDTPELRGLIAFLNVGTAGFVLAALGLRFTFPAVSLEGRSWWVLKAAPVSLDRVLRQKLAFSVLPMLAVAVALGAATSVILDSDAFTARLTLGALCVIALAVSAMGVGFGALFPRFTVENVHQIESSAGGFAYMAACLFYVGATLAALAPPMRMHLQRRLGTPWDGGVAAASFAAWGLLTAVAVGVPWVLGRRALEAHEE